MELKISTENDIRYIEVSGRLDAVISAELQDKLMELVQAGHKKMLVCMDQVEYISSSGLRTFLAVAKKVGQEGFIRFCCMQPGVKEVFTISGFNSIFGIYDSREEGLAG